MKGGEFLDHLSDYQLLKNVCEQFVDANSLSAGAAMCVCFTTAI
jgi:hypothetical protein